MSDLLKNNTYLKELTTEDYFVRAVEITMDHYHYQSDLLYDLNEVCHEIFNTFKEEYQERYDILEKRFVDIPIKELFSKIKKLSSKDAICAFYHSLNNNEEIETTLISNIFRRIFNRFTTIYACIIN